MNFIDKRIEKANETGKELIDYAAERLGEALDQRIQLAKDEIGDLVSKKLGEIREELVYVTQAQKKSAIHNASIAIAAAIGVALVSLAYKRATAGSLDLYSVIRSGVLALAIGQGVWIVAKLVTNYLNMTRVQRQFVLYAAQFTDAFKMKGLALQVTLMFAAAACWIALHFHSN